MIDVAIAVICYGDEYLLAYRQKGLHEGDKLEFVGGKVEVGETEQMALVREVAEEIGLDISQQSMTKIGEICHDYGDKAVRLLVYQVALSDECYQDFKAITQGKQGQALYWYDKKTLLTLGDKLPKANGMILQWLACGSKS